METHYHSQYDNEEFYQEAVYRFHHELYTRLLVTLDQLTLPPLDFSRHFLAMKSSVADCLQPQSNAPAEVLKKFQRFWKVFQRYVNLPIYYMKRFRRSTTILFPLTSQWCPDFLLNCCTFSGRCRTTSSASTGRTQSASLMLLPVRTSVTWSRQSMHWKARTSPPHWRHSMKLIITATHFYSMKKSIITLRNIFYISQKTV